MVGILTKILLLLLLLASPALAQSYSLRVKTSSGDVNQPGVRTIIVPDDTLSCLNNVCTLALGGASAITGTGTANTMTRWTNSSVIGNASSFTYSSATNPMLKATGLGSNLGSLWLQENGAANVLPAPEASQGILTIQQKNAATMWGIVMSNDTVATEWGIYVSDGTGSLLFTPSGGGSIYMRDTSQLYVGTEDLTGIAYVMFGGAGGSTAFGQILANAGNTFSLGVGTDETTNTAKPLTWSADGVTVTGELGLTPVAFLGLGTPANGVVRFCSDCTVTSGASNVCAGSGNGALAVRINGAWRCFNLQN